MSDGPVLFNSKTPEWDWLSNFSPHAILHYATAEHAYQSAKTLDQKEKDKIRTARTPQDAKKVGRRITQREDWENIKLEAMRRVLLFKFRTHPELRAKLLATGDRELIHYAPWGDTYWGVDRGHQGLNMQGNLLMAIRVQLREEEIDYEY